MTTLYVLVAAAVVLGAAGLGLAHRPEEKRVRIRSEAPRRR